MHKNGQTEKKAVQYLETRKWNDFSLISFQFRINFLFETQRFSIDFLWLLIKRSSNFISREARNAC